MPRSNNALGSVLFAVSSTHRASEQVVSEGSKLMTSAVFTRLLCRKTRNFQRECFPPRTYPLQVPCQPKIYSQLLLNSFINSVGVLVQIQPTPRAYINFVSFTLSLITSGIFVATHTLVHDLRVQLRNTYSSFSHSRTNSLKLFAFELEKPLVEYILNSPTDADLYKNADD